MQIASLASRDGRHDGASISSIIAPSHGSGVAVMSRESLRRSVSLMSQAVPVRYRSVARSATRREQG